MTEAHISVTKAEGRWVIRAGGAILGESGNALMLEEGNLPYVIYFPREDVEMAFLDPSDHRTTCPHKGEATYYTIVAKSGPIENAAWSYEDPKEDVARIKDHLAFYSSDRVTVEQI
ncbi:DUF427 domain-containing protein [Algicella marina]|uniref:DUF427 domain-containing protein n=2 Tax=Algicella marina TaxID=2683284 RepID=A0A6P1T7J4_9RHOB|nr:DUF427 domain-containing protein [Algicella marina]QHQ37259.1 DUF427 domain-containing protein [Algicella marina]